MFCLFSVSSAMLLPLRFSAPPHSVVTCACDHFFSKLCANRLVPNNIFIVINGLNNLKSNYELP